MNEHSAAPSALDGNKAVEVVEVWAALGVGVSLADDRADVVKIEPL